MLCADAVRRGLLELCRDKYAAVEVRRLLDPRGDLFLAVLAMQAADAVTRFEVALGEFVEAAGAKGGAATPDPDAGRTVRLDYCEYFYFHLAKVVTALPLVSPAALAGIRSGAPAQAAHRRDFPSLGLGPDEAFAETVVRWNHDLVARTYRQVLEAHLEYALPTASKEHVFASPLFRSKAVAAARLGEALCGLATQLWLAPFTPKARHLATLDVIQAAETVVKHLAGAICASPPPNRHLAQAIETCFAAVRVPLYQFLKAALVSWPMDQNFMAVISLWLAFAAPWRFVDVSTDVQFWTPYVLNNYFFYICPLNLVLEHIGAALESLVALQVRTKLVLTEGDFVRRLAPTINCLHACLQALHLVAPLLLRVETTAFAARRATPYGEYRLGEQLAALEPLARTVPSAFDAAAVTRAMELIRWLDRAHGCIPPAELALDGKLLECQDRLAQVFDISDEAYAQFAEQQAALEAADHGSSLTPRRRNLIPSTPDSKLAAIRGISAASARTFSSDEVPILAAVFAGASAHINALLQLGLRRLDRRVPVPPWAFQCAKVDLRFLAVWQNLLFTVVATWVAGILLRQILFRQ